jgi:glycosyltransferase involved in cell wall biosynthesis
LCQAPVPEGIDLIFIGDMNRADGVCRMAIEKKMREGSNVYALGPIYGDDKVAAMRAADIILVPSYHETFGNVGMEGLAAGKIVFSSGVGGLSDYLDDRNSIACGTSERSIGQAYMRFMKMSENERESMRAAGIQRAKTMTVERAGQALAKVFREALSPK